MPLTLAEKKIKAHMVCSCHVLEQYIIAAAFVSAIIATNGVRNIRILILMTFVLCAMAVSKSDMAISKKKVVNMIMILHGSFVVGKEDKPGNSVVKIKLAIHNNM